MEKEGPVQCAAGLPMKNCDSTDSASSMDHHRDSTHENNQSNCCLLTLLSTDKDSKLCSVNSALVSTAQEHELNHVKTTITEDVIFPPRQPPIATDCDSLHIQCNSNGEQTSTNTFTPQLTKKRSRKRKAPDDIRVKCPICSSQLLPRDLANHLACETSKLDHITRRIKTPQSAKKSATIDECASHKRYQSYLRIRYNREKRHHVKKREGEKETTCPVCMKVISGTQAELGVHVDKCLNGDVEEVDVEDEDSYEEYTWAGQTRVRATSLLEGGVSDLGYSNCNKPASGDESGCDGELDVDIDGDNSLLYGISQYTEADLKPRASEEPEEEKRRSALREALIQGAESEQAALQLEVESERASPHLENQSSTHTLASSINMGSPSPPEPTQQTTSSSLSDTTCRNEASCSSQNNSSHTLSRQQCDKCGQSALSEALKETIRNLQKQMDSTEQQKCLICMDWYSRPLVSIQCWHVHCEQCWLQTLGAKKLCPQCNMITSPSELRRIYL